MKSFKRRFNISGRLEDALNECDAQRLGLTRILVAGMLLVGLAFEDLQVLHHLPPTMARPNGIMTWVFHLGLGEALLSSPLALAGLKLLAATALICVLIGYKTRLALWLATPSLLLIGGLVRCMSTFHHSDHVLLLMLPILALSNCDQAYSLSHWKNKCLDQPESHSKNDAWAMFCLWALVSLCYFSSGISKLISGGGSWFDANSMRARMLRGGLKTIEYGEGGIVGAYNLPDGFFLAAACLVLSAELAAPMILVSRRLRKVLPCVYILFHGLVFWFQNILFFEFILLQFIFLWNKPSPLKAANESRRPNKLVLGATLSTVLGTLALAGFQRNYYPLTPYRMYVQAEAFPVRYERAFRRTNDGLIPLKAPPGPKGRKQIKKYLMRVANNCVLEPKASFCPGLIQVLSSQLGIQNPNSLVVRVSNFNRDGTTTLLGQHP